MREGRCRKRNKITRSAMASRRWAAPSRRASPATRAARVAGKNNLSALLLAALDEPVYLTIDGHRRKITKREAIVTQMVDKSASADLRATKMLIDMMEGVEHRAVGDAAPPPEPRRL